MKNRTKHSLPKKIGQQALKSCLVFVLSIVIANIGVKSLQAQQAADNEFQYVNKQPAFAVNKGPKLLIDKAHSPYIARGAYEPFAKLVREDGFQTSYLETSISSNTLADVQILVVVNAYKKSFPQFSVMQPPAAHETTEIEFISDWVSKGGRLLIIGDHVPFAGGTSALAEKFGFTFFNGYVVDKTAFPFRHGDIDYRIGKGLDGNHPIVSGKYANEAIKKLYTFSGTAFIPPENAQNLLTIPNGYVVVFSSRSGDFETAPKFNVSGLSAGSTLIYGKGRIAVFAEAGAFTAQRVNKIQTMGMNDPKGAENPLFALATLRWLAEGL